MLAIKCIWNYLNFVCGHYLTGELKRYPYLLKSKKNPPFVFFQKYVLPHGKNLTIKANLFVKLYN